MTGIPPELPPWWLWEQLDQLPAFSPRLQRRIHNAALESQFDQRVPSDVLPPAPTGPERPTFTSLPPTLEARPQIESPVEQQATRHASYLEALQRARKERAGQIGPVAAGFEQGLSRALEPVAAATGDLDAIRQARERAALEREGYDLPSENTEIASGEVGRFGKAFGAHTGAESGEAAGQLVGSAPYFMAGGEVAPLAERAAGRVATELALPGAARGALTGAARGVTEFGVGSGLEAAAEAGTAGKSPKEIIQEATRAALAGATSPLALIHVPGEAIKRQGISNRVRDLKAARYARMTGELVPGAVRVPPEPTIPERALAAVGEEAPAAVLGATVGGAAGAQQGPDEALAGAAAGAVAGPLLHRAAEHLAPGEVGALGPQRFFSRVDRAIEAAPFDKGTAEQWRAALERAPGGVAKGELTHRGLDSWLDERKGTVLTRDEVRAAASERPLDVGEVRFPTGRVKPDPAVLKEEHDAAVNANLARNALIASANARGVDRPEVVARGIFELAQRGFGETEIIQRMGLRNSMDEAVRAYAQAARRSIDATEAADVSDVPERPPRYPEYQLPGGENYREIVLTAPVPSVRRGLPASDWQAMERPMYPEAREMGATGRWVLRERGTGSELAEILRTPNPEGGGAYAWREFGGPWHYAEPGALEDVTARVEAAISGQSARAAGTYTSSHWPGVTNPVAHIRLTDRTINGEPTTFLEEIQSDVHEQGRERGYQDEIAGHLTAEELGPGMWRVSNGRGQSVTFHTGVNSAQEAIARARRDNINHLGGAGVPRLPFSRTEDWVGLAVRKALDEAVQNGSTRLAWTTGEQQAQRWSQQLQRGLSGVRYDGTMLEYRRQGSEYWEPYQATSPEELPGVVGRQLADQLTAAETGPTPTPEVTSPEARVSIDQLAQAARGMRHGPYHSAAQRILSDIRDMRDDELELPEAWHHGNVVDTWGDETEVGRPAVERLWERATAIAEDRPFRPEPPRNWRTITGTDLVIGAQGMRTFYDEIVPRVVRDYFRRLGEKVEVEKQLLGATTKQYPAEVGPMGVAELASQAAAAGADRLEDRLRLRADMLYEQGDVLRQSELMRLAHTPGEREILGGLLSGGKSGGGVWSVQLPESIRKRVGEQGQYLYSGFDPTRLKDLPPEVTGAVVGGAAGGVVGARKDEPVAGAALGAVVGAVGGRRISEALKARRAAAGVEAMKVTPPLEASAAAPDIRVEPEGIVHPAPSIRAEPHVLPGRERPINVDDYVNQAKFDTDPSGAERLKAEVERVVQNTGMNPKEVVPWAETRRLAANLGIDLSDKSVGTVNRRLSGPEMLAIRNIVSANVEALEKLSQRRAEVPDGSEPALALDKQTHAIESQNARLLERFIRSRSQTGRDLNNLKIIANRTLEPTLWLTKATQFAGRDLTADEITTVSRLAEQRDRLGLVRYISALRKSTPFEKLVTLWKAGLLTNPKTHVVNIVSNTTMAALELAKDPVAALSDRLLSLVTGVRTKGGWSASTLPVGLRGAVEGLAEAKAAYRGEPSGEALAKYDLPHETNFDNVFLDTYTKTVFRLLGAEDRVYWWAAFRRSMAEQATVAGRQQGLRGVKLREYVANAQQGRGLLGDELSTQAMADADLTTFRDKTALGDIAAYAARRLKPLEFIIPFRRTPAAVATSVLRFSPAGLGKAAVWDLPRFLTAVAQGKDNVGGVPLKVVQRQLSEAVGRGTVGSAAIWLGWLLAKDGNATGAAPTTGSKERQQWLQENRQPNSIKVDGTWYQVGRVSPLGNLIALGANLRSIWGPEGAERTPQERYAEVVASGLRTVADQPFVTGVSQALNALQSPEQEAANFARGMEASVVPAIVGATARGLDPTARSRAGAMSPILERVPGLREQLEPQVTPLGEPVQRGPTSQPAALFNALFNPFTASPDLRASDPLIKELSDAGYAVPRLPQQKGEGAISYTRRQQLYGRVVRQSLDALIQSPEYQTLQGQEQQLQQQAAELANQPGWNQYPVERIQRALEDAMKASSTQPVTRAEALQRVVTQVRAQLTRALVPQQ